MKKLIFAASLIWVQMVQAQPSFGVYNSLSCGDFVAKSSNKVTVAMASEYVRGYLSAHNFYAKRNQITADLSNSTIALYVEKFCRENPLLGIHNAAASLAIELSGTSRPKSQ